MGPPSSCMWATVTWQEPPTQKHLVPIGLLIWLPLGLVLSEDALDLQHGMISPLPAGMDSVMASRQASHAAASSSNGSRQLSEFGSVPLYPAAASSYLQQQQQQASLPSDFDRLLNQAHEVYRAGDFHRALQLCQAVRATRSQITERSLSGRYTVPPF